MGTTETEQTATGPGPPSPPRRGPLPLPSGATVAVVGGGPAGAFLAIHLLRGAAARGRQIRVIVIERHHEPVGQPPAAGPVCWRGCNHCAGGISPRLNDVMRSLDLVPPEAMVQRRIRAVTIQGHWKNITLEVPRGREMFTVYRGSRPSGRPDPQQTFDGFLLDAARMAGAEVIGGEMVRAERADDGRPLLCYETAALRRTIGADLVVFACGVNGRLGSATGETPELRAIRTLIPGFRPPATRRALIFELGLETGGPSLLNDEICFVEYGSGDLPIEMCSLVPKRDFLTAVIVGRAVDRAVGPAGIRAVVGRFLDLPHIRKLAPPHTRLRLACTCSPSMVVRSARNPFGDRVAVIGDMVTTRLYKDGILSAEHTARALADTVLDLGMDAGAIRRGYGPTVHGFTRDNRFAAIVFLLHRIVFGSSLLSRVLYQAVLTERKGTPAPRRRLERILWNVASGDDRYEQIFRDMMRPSTWWSILVGGALVTLRNFAAEVFFGLRWKGFGRFTTGVAWERMETKRLAFSRWLAEFRLPSRSHFEFERMYTIRIRAPLGRVFEELGRFGEPDRPYLHPRWVQIRRVAGVPNQHGCTIQYSVVIPQLSFRLSLEHVVPAQLAVYRVQNGFARGGVLIFEIEGHGPDACDLSIYVAFNFRRGRRRRFRPIWWLLRYLFPAFVHDVIWNHSLCQLKDHAEARHHADGISLDTVLSSTLARQNPSEFPLR